MSMGEYPFFSPSFAAAARSDEVIDFVIVFFLSLCTEKLSRFQRRVVLLKTDDSINRIKN
jgi:aspartate 1-decarboxylase